MFASAILDLPLKSSWDPARLIAAAFRWPADAPEVPLRDIATRLFPRTFADAGSPVVTPQDLDTLTGGVRRRSREYQGAVFQVGGDLRIGDVLVPRAGSGPAILVSEHLRGALVSARFSAIRPVDPELGLWLWAVLSSESGLRFRATLSQGSSAASVDVGTLLDSSVPAPPLEQMRASAAVLAEVHGSTLIEEEAATETWWSTADLREFEWRFALATPDPAVLTHGEPLADFCGEMAVGCATRALALEAEAPGHLPVCDVSALGGKPPRRWVPIDEGRPVVANPGDLLVAQLGKLPHARVADRAVVVDQHVFVLRLRNPEHGPALARHLNGQDAYRIRQMFLTGTTIPSLSLADLRQFPVPHDALRVQPVGVVPVPLAQRLEQVLWGS